MEDRRFIEETFPVKEVGEESAKEKSIRHGHISTLHLWWARRPLASSRATSYAALVPAAKNADERNKKRQFIIKFSKWENSLNQTMIEQARKDILNASGGKPPKVLDPFSGGGAIPLEALRLGCETYASDYSPVATLILKCTLEYPQKYGRAKGSTKDWGTISSRQAKNQLLEDVKKWGSWVLEEAKKELGEFYPNDPDGSIPVGYVWARTIPCQNLSCGAEIPLIRQFWLARKAEKLVSLYPYVERKEVRFKVVGTGYEKMPSGFDPERGTVVRAVAVCPICGSTVDGNTTRRLFQKRKAGQRMVVLVTHKEGRSGKQYRIVNKGDMAVFRNAEEYLKEKREKLMAEWGIDPIPDEAISPTPSDSMGGTNRVLNYGIETWGALFNLRQKLALITFTEKVRKAHAGMLEEGYDEEYARAVAAYLAIILDRLLTFSSTLARIDNTRETISNMFNRQALGMIWDYAECNVFSDATGDWKSALDWVLRVIEHISQFSGSNATVAQSSAAALPYPDDFFDAVLTDPPYYDNVPYSYLSDFFYVWLKRSIGHLYPDLFATPLTPKKDEIVAYSGTEGGFDEGKKFFESMLKKSFIEINRVLKPNGISVIVYAHKSSAGWETLINSLLDSGLVVTGAWPIHTEMKTRLVAKESAALASSIYMVARKSGREKVGFYREVRGTLKTHLEDKLDQLWGEGISGADFFISAIGSSIEVFGKYERIIDDEGNVIRADRLLEDVRRIVTDYAVKQVLHNGIAAEIKPMTRFYVLWRWAYGDMKIEFGDALKLGQGIGIDLAHEWNKGFIQKDKEFIRILGPEQRELEELKGSNELIDVLHNVLLLWKKGRNDDILKVLGETGFGKSDVFYRIAQAVSESLPNGNKEKKLLEGFVQGKERLSESLRKDAVQRRLFE